MSQFEFGGFRSCGRVPNNPITDIMHCRRTDILDRLFIWEH